MKLFAFSASCLIISAFEIGSSYSFKEIYKKYYKVIFVRNQVDRPYDWPYSRQSNHNKFIAFKWITGFFIISTIICGVITKLWLPLIISVALTPALIFFGKWCGKKICHFKVKRKCKKFKIEMQEID